MMEELETYWKKETEFNEISHYVEENEEKMRELQESIRQLEQDNLRVMKYFI